MKINTSPTITAIHTAAHARRSEHWRLVSTAAALALVAPVLCAGPAFAGSTATDKTSARLGAGATAGATARLGLTEHAVGINFHAMWTSYTDAQRTMVLDKLAAAGVDSVRMDVSWVMLQPTNGTSYDAWGVAFIDRVIAMENQRGIKPLVMLWLTPGWANANAGQRTLPTNPADYARAAQWAANRWHGKVVGWEVWNEPNDTGFMKGADPVAYTRLLKAAYPAVKAGDPTTSVVTGGTSYNDDKWIGRMYDAGAKGYFDAVGTHPYQGFADADPALADDGSMYTFSHAKAVRNLMVARGDGAKPIWFTEFGWSTHANTASTPNWNRGVSESVQSTYLAKAAGIIGSTMPWVQRAYWYADRDTTTGNVQYDNYGLFHSDLTAKPALTGLAQANA